MQERKVQVDARQPEAKFEKRLSPGSQFGEGGMSVLLDAFDSNLMRSIAMKVLREDMVKDEHAAGTMVVEAQTTAQLDHPNIVPIYELGMDKKKRLYFTMKKVHGKALHELIDEQDLSNRSEGDLFRMVQIMLRVCDAVSYAHSKGVLHRDLKPDNIMVGKFGQVYLMDWGVASLGGKEGVPAPALDAPGAKRCKKYKIKKEKSGSVVGTPCYMAPEQALGNLDAIDERSDIFSIGAILYEILTGTPPIMGDSLIQMVRSARKCEIQFPDDRVDFPLPIGLVRIAMKAMSKDPSDRYQSVKEMKDELESFLAGGWYFPKKIFKAGELIVREGDEGVEAYIIRRGRCRAFKTTNGEKIEVRVMGVGDVFGETSVFTSKPRSMSVEAVDEVSVSVVTKHHLEEGLGLGAWLGIFLNTLSERFREADQRARHYEKLLNDREKKETSSSE